MDKELSIFLSHKLGGDAERNAKTVAGNLALFGGPNIRVILSADFQRGEEWEPKIQEGLEKADWMILLYTGPGPDWDWCLYETGFFRALMPVKQQEHGKGRLVCLHDPNYAVPSPLRGLVSVPGTEDKVRELFEDIYQKKPWELNPSVFINNVDAVNDAVRRVCLASRGSIISKNSLQISPSINLRIKKTALSDLRGGLIPPSSPVTGEGIWETVFGKPERTAGWTWGDLTNGVANSSTWEYQLSTMMADAVERRAVQYPSIAIRMSVIGADNGNEIYRIGLRRVSEFEGEEFEFSFVLSRIRTPYEPSADDRETMLYHLFNLAWYFRRRFIEHHKRAIEDLLDLKRSRREFDSPLKDAIRNLSVDLKVLEADAQVRGLERSMQVRRAFPFDEQEKVTQFLNIDFPPLMQRLNEAVRSATPQPDDINAILVEMDPINEWFLEHSLKELNRVVESRGA